jgi:hypothetical protein
MLKCGEADLQWWDVDFKKIHGIDHYWIAGQLSWCMAWLLKNKMAKMLARCSSFIFNWPHHFQDVPTRLVWLSTVSVFPSAPHSNLVFFHLVSSLFTLSHLTSSNLPFPSPSRHPLFPFPPCSSHFCLLPFTPSIFS